MSDLDAEFGGKVYVAEYGSNMDSASFWITADLAGNAPEGSVLQLETTGLDGEKQNAEMSKSGYTDGIRYNIAASVFAAGENGSKKSTLYYHRRNRRGQAGLPDPGRTPS